MLIINIYIDDSIIILLNFFDFVSLNKESSFIIFKASSFVSLKYQIKFVKFKNFPKALYFLSLLTIKSLATNFSKTRPGSPSKPLE